MNNTPLTRADLLALDAADPLAGVRNAFELPAGVIYLDGNSLGPKPAGALEVARRVIEGEWGTGLIRSWNDAGWFELPARLGDKVAGLLGGAEGTAVVTDTTSVNLFKTAAAALRIQAADHPEKRTIYTQRENFPSDIYILTGLAEQLNQGRTGGSGELDTWESVPADAAPYRVELVDDAEVVAWGDGSRPVPEDAALIVLTHVNYRTGRLFPMAQVSRAAHAAGALTVWDLCHSAGALPIALRADGADFAVGCTYKYLNGGPGSPAFLWVSPEHVGRFSQPLSGWWGHNAPFAMSPEYTPADDVRRYLTGTQGMLSMSVAELGLDIAADSDIAAVREKSLAMTDLFIRLVRERLADHPLTLVTPEAHAERGSQVSIAHPEGFAVMQALIARGVIGDYREPEVLRFGFTPLYLSYADVWDAVEVLREVLDDKLWDAPEYRRRGAVT
ncbi:kynureninase [Brevibacterium sp. 50QC2O2]|uniref:kynureninase n=1 Tax=Brevibacterium sp. 50QC2O2 TaxID=2968459 RepID=UPI00211C7D40|nr:kynureninase [Brevibacterium sp. 50QC2O2]MCQ9387275.1 kynureninase [Brevibacterium sp. 50QC2O2]